MEDILSVRPAAKRQTHCAEREWHGVCVGGCQADLASSARNGVVSVNLPCVYTPTRHVEYVNYNALSRLLVSARVP